MNIVKNNDSLNVRIVFTFILLLTFFRLKLGSHHDDSTWKHRQCYLYFRSKMSGSPDYTVQVRICGLLLLNMHPSPSRNATFCSLFSLYYLLTQQFMPVYMFLMLLKIRRAVLLDVVIKR